MENNIVRIELNVVNNKVSSMRVDNIGYISLRDLVRYLNAVKTKISI